VQREPKLAMANTAACTTSKAAAPAGRQRLPTCCAQADVIFRDLGLRQPQFLLHQFGEIGQRSVKVRVSWSSAGDQVEMSRSLAAGSPVLSACWLCPRAV
jgi:hypothetical protein